MTLYLAWNGIPDHRGIWGPTLGRRPNFPSNWRVLTDCLLYTGHRSEAWEGKVLPLWREWNPVKKENRKWKPRKLITEEK